MVTSNAIKLNQLAWHEDDELELDFPSSWDVNVCYMKGHSAPALSEEQIRQAFANPIGTKRIRELAKGKNEVVILFDDMSRPTKAYQLVPHILRELEEAGIPDDHIRFIPTLGCHGAMKRTDFARKLGKEVIDRFAVYNHNCYENFTYAGKTSRGTPVNANAEVMSCDLKIAIGCILPHPRAGFGGGAKAILPGICSIDTIRANHHDLTAMPNGQRHPSLGKGKVDDNIARLDMEEVARLVGLDIIANVVVNGKRDPAGLFVGDLVAAHREAVKLARENYASKIAQDVDVVIINNYSKATESGVLGFRGDAWYKESGGSCVMIINTPDGEVTHYLHGGFGKNLGGQDLATPKLPPKIKRLIVLSPYPEQRLVSRFGSPQDVVCVKTWDEALKKLQEVHGDDTKVAVIPDEPLQMFPG